MVAGGLGQLDPSAGRLGLQLYTVAHRSLTERLLQGPTTRHWSGDLVVGRDAALLFANLDTGRWRFSEPWRLRMELKRRPNTLSGRRPAIVPRMLTNDAIEAQRRLRWQPYLPVVPVHAFAPQSRGSRYLYLGTTRPGPYGGGSSAFGRRVYIDCRLRPSVPDELWKELRSHTLEIDGQVIERGADGEVVELGNLGQVLEPIRRRRRAEASIHRRGLGVLTYSKAGRSRVLTYRDPRGHTRVTHAAWEQGALDALWLFWAEGFLAPWLEWR
jgi:hypothetical protein